MEFANNNVRFGQGYAILRKKINDSLCINLKMCILEVIDPFINTSPIRCTTLSSMSTKITKICVTNEKFMPLFDTYPHPFCSLRFSKRVFVMQGPAEGVKLFFPPI